MDAKKKDSKTPKNYFFATPLSENNKKKGGKVAAPPPSGSRTPAELRPGGFRNTFQKNFSPFIGLFLLPFLICKNKGSKTSAVR